MSGRVLIHNLDFYLDDDAKYLIFSATHHTLTHKYARMRMHNVHIKTIVKCTRIISKFMSKHFFQNMQA